MKEVIMKTVVVASLLMCVSLVALSKGNIFVQGKDRLPVKAQNFIDVNLEKERIVYVKESRTLFLRKEYLAVFANGLKIEFDSNGDWIDMLSDKKGLPKNLVPEKVWLYVKEYYASSDVMEIEKKRKSVLRVLLSNRKEIFFDREGRKMNMEV